MSWSLTIGRFGATTVRVHLTFFLLLAWIGVSAWEKGGLPAARDSVLFIALIFTCVVLHEFGHIIMARRFGIETPDVILLPIGGVARMPRMPQKPAQELAVAIAGPMVNVAIAFLLFLVLGTIQPDDLTRIEDPRVSFLARLAAANVFLVIFNMIPAFPMDGGRVLHAVLAMKLGGARATQIAAAIGQALAFALGFLGLFGNPLLIFHAYRDARHDAKRDKLPLQIRKGSAMDMPNRREGLNISTIGAPLWILFRFSFGLFVGHPVMSPQAEFLWGGATIIIAFLVWFGGARAQQRARKDRELLNEIKQLVTKPETTLEDVRKAVRSAVGASAITDTISDLYSNTQLVLREEAERIRADKEQPRG